MKKVSVVIAAYNCESYIEKSIDSILNQSYRNLEIVVCDDNSNDRTWEVLQKYSLNNKVKILKNDRNMFAAYARNKCLDLANGEFIAIQDSDDFSEPNRIEVLVKFLEQNKEYGLVGSNLNLFDNNGIWMIGKKPRKPSKSDFLFAMPFAHATLMFRREVLDNIGGYRISKETRRTEDYDMIMRIYAAGYYGYNVEQSLYNYRVDKNTIQRRKFKYRIDEMKVRYKRFKELELLPKGYLFVIKPLLVGLIPGNLLMKIKQKF